MSPTPAKRKTETLHGIGASPGVAVGRAFLLNRKKVKTPRYDLPEKEIESELMRFKTAVELSDYQLGEVKERLEQSEGREHALIVEAHRMMLNDPMLIDEVRRIIRTDRTNAEWATRRAVRKIKQQFEKLEDEYFRERRADVDFVGDRLIRNLLGQVVDALDGPAIPEDAVIVCHELSPSDAALLLQAGKCAGFITDLGGHTSHTAIVARSRQIPGVVGAAVASERINAGDLVAIDGGRGMVVIAPTEEQVSLFREALRREIESEAALARLRELPCTQLDGRRLQLCANIEFKEEVPGALSHGAEGVGLFRTEFLYLGKQSAPTEEEHVEAYRAVLAQMGDRPVIIRTVDLGGDKIAQLDHSLRREKEQNPALGLRALRFCLKHRDVFKVQLRALLRASVHGKMRIMFPMVSNIQELREAKGLLARTRDELVREGVPVAEEIPVGIMVETPSAALTADRLARECDFFSVGTNDLIQYTVAIDRQNRDVAYLYHPLQLAMLRLLKTVVDGAHAAGIPVGMCGEMAGDPMHALILAGLGFDSLSMSPGQVPAVKRILRASRSDEGEALLQQCLQLDTSEEIERLVRTVMEGRFGTPSSEAEATAP
jgi:phosphotransferase system enzyme I (PtsI)